MIMESKYKERVTELLNSVIWEEIISVHGFNSAVNTMCQLAEEVEKEYKYCIRNTHLMPIGIPIYSKEQVEELLAKQRELCCEQVMINQYNHDTDKTRLIRATCVGEPPVFEFEIDYDSILNAKLKLD